MKIPLLAFTLLPIVGGAFGCRGDKTTVPRENVASSAEASARAPEQSKPVESSDVEAAAPYYEDKVFAAWKENVLSSCTLPGEADGSNAAMARQAWSEFECFVNAGSAFAKSLPPKEREAIFGTSHVGSGNAWFRDWERLAALTSELSFFIELANEGRGFTGGTMLVVLRPARFTGVAANVAYWLQAISTGDPKTLATRMTASAPHGVAAEHTLQRLEESAKRYLSKTAETAIPEFYPTHIQALDGGDFRRVLYDIRELRQLVPELAKRLCLGSAELSKALDGELSCAALASKYLLSEVTGSWPNAPATESPDDELHPAGLDLTYASFASSTYEACEFKEGKTSPYGTRVECLNKVLASLVRAPETHSREGRQQVSAIVAYLSTLCRLETSKALWVHTPLTANKPTRKECSAAKNVRAAFFVTHWKHGDPASIRSHVEAHRPWGKHILAQLASLETLFRRGTEMPTTPSGLGLTASQSDYRAALHAVRDARKAAEGLAHSQCASENPLATERSSACENELTEYWLSYAHVAGLPLETDEAFAKPTVPSAVGATGHEHADHEPKGHERPISQ